MKRGRMVRLVWWVSADENLSLKWRSWEEGGREEVEELGGGREPLKGQCQMVNLPQLMLLNLSVASTTIAPSEAPCKKTKQLSRANQMEKNGKDPKKGSQGRDSHMINNGNGQPADSSADLLKSS